MPSGCTLTIVLSIETASSLTRTICSRCRCSNTLSSTPFLAHQEDKQIVPDTPDSHDALVQEIMECDNLLGGIEARLGAFGAMTQQLPAVKQVKRTKNPWVVLTIDLEAKRYYAQSYREEQWDSAAKFYMDEEVKNHKNPRIETVMVSVASVRELKKAFPNYYADLNEFRRLLKKTIG